MSHFNVETRRIFYFNSTFIKRYVVILKTDFSDYTFPCIQLQTLKFKKFKYSELTYVEVTVSK